MQSSHAATTSLEVVFNPVDVFVLIFIGILYLKLLTAEAPLPNPGRYTIPESLTLTPILHAQA